jgi:hypothetical protein
VLPVDYHPSSLHSTLIGVVDVAVNAGETARLRDFLRTYAMSAAQTTVEVEAVMRAHIIHTDINRHDHP